jgi:hypothetical protein
MASGHGFLAFLVSWRLGVLALNWGLKGRKPIRWGFAGGTNVFPLETWQAGRSGGYDCFTGGTDVFLLESRTIAMGEWCRWESWGHGIRSPGRMPRIFGILVMPLRRFSSISRLYIRPRRRSM